MSLVPKAFSSGAKAQERFGKQDFVYIVAGDEYRRSQLEGLVLLFHTVFL
jgi:hypothetical protein